jgi:uncharacterized PurR-regulated membrane protein YhhQ (DUF165 family)
MKSMSRWMLAICVTVGAFIISVFVCGAILLPIWIKSEADRWVIAAGLGVAVAALAALWGASFAQSDHSDASVSERHSPKGIHMKARTSGKSRVYQAGGDQTINDR